MLQPWDLIFVQDSPQQTPWISSPLYHVEFYAHGPCTDSKHPPEQRRVSFYIRNDIRVEDFYVRWHTDYIATLSLTTTSGGTIMFHNVYNVNPKSDIRKAVEKLKAIHPSYILVGDFNLHHKSWGGPHMKQLAEARANELYEATRYDTMLVTLPGVSTYARHPFLKMRHLPNVRYESVIDLIFISNDLATRVRHYKTLDVEGFESDHRPVKATLDMEANREAPERYLFRCVNKKKMRKLLKRLFHQVEFPELSNELAIEEYGRKILGVFREAIERCVPKARPKSPRANPAMTPRVKEARALEKKMLRLWQERQQLHILAAWKMAKRRKIRLIRIEKCKIWRRFIGRPTDSRGIHVLAKYGARLNQPRKLPHMPPQREGDHIHYTGPAKADFTRRILFPDTSDEGECPRPVDLPQLDPGRKQYDSLQDLHDGEIAVILGKLKLGTSHGSDRVSNDVFRIAKGIIDPCFEHMMRACLVHSLDPNLFKRAVTVVIPKEGKANDTPKGWRTVHCSAVLPGEDLAEDRG